MFLSRPRLFAFVLLATVAACTVPRQTGEEVIINGEDYDVWVLTTSKAFGSEDSPGDIKFTSYYISYRGERIHCYIKNIQACLPVWEKGIADIDNEIANPSSDEGDRGAGSGGSGGDTGGSDSGGTDL